MNVDLMAWRAHASRHPSALLLAAQLFGLVLYAALDGNPSARAILPG